MLLLVPLGKRAIDLALSSGDRAWGSCIEFIELRWLAMGDTDAHACQP